MEALFEFIFGNFFIVLLVIFGILGFLRDNAAKQKEEERKRRTRPTRPAPQTSRGPVSSGGDSRSSRRNPLETVRETISSSSIEEQQKEQMEKLANRFNTRANETVDELQEGISSTKMLLQEPGKDLSKEQEEIKRGVSHSLKGKGLINGIIMSEVLGPPRARKPYRSVITERRNG